MKHLIYYVESCQPKVKAYKSKDNLNKFVEEFRSKYDTMDELGDNWIELIIFDIQGKVLVKPHLQKDSRK